VAVHSFRAGESGSPKTQEAEAMNDSEVKGGANLWADTIRAEWRGWLAMVAVVLLGFGLRAAYYHGG